MNRPNLRDSRCATDTCDCFRIFLSMRFGSKCFRIIHVFFLQFFLLLAAFPMVHARSTSDHGKPAMDLVPDSLIGLSSEDGPAYAIVVEKDTQTLRLYEYSDDFALKHTFVCSTGEVPGKKEGSGDRKTPEGIYLFTKAFKKRDLSATYGNRAFVMDYPNIIDRKFNRDGNNIWLHGTNKPIRPRDSNGCVVMENEHIDTLARYIRLNRTAIIIKNKLHMVSPESLEAEQKSLTKFVEDWKSAFVAGDRAKYLAFYSEPPPDLDRLWEIWHPIRRAWQSAQVRFDMSFRNMTLARGNPCVVAVFDQFIHLDRLATRVGTKKLFLEPTGNTWKIVGEVFQPGASNPETAKPIATSLVRLDDLQKNHRATGELICEWADAWSCKDIKRYRVCYAEDFRSSAMDLSAWLRYKENINKRYASIHVSIEDLDIRENLDRGTATFVQRYRSSGLKSVGKKTLYLKRVEGEWKIHRERWHGSLK